MQAKGGEVLVTKVVRELVAGKGFAFGDRGEVVLRGWRTRCAPLRAELAGDLTRVAHSVAALFAMRRSRTLRPRDIARFLSLRAVSATRKLPRPSLEAHGAGEFSTSLWRKAPA